MNKGSLPGLYYGQCNVDASMILMSSNDLTVTDPEKKRYFPIQANHQAFGSASKYSQENVRKRKRERQERQKELARCSRLSKEMLKRSCLLSNPFSPGLALQREIGYRKELHHQECPKYDFNNASKVPLVGLQNG
ncbi:hypothetical protein KEM56_007411, partial [Ascosphaera pollenicola]